MVNALVSVITPSYNEGQFIRKTIESVVMQDYSPIEHWVIDGASTDNTLEVLEEYEDKINYISEPDNGQAEAINKGLRLSKGDILIILNSDDYLCEGAVKSAVNHLLENPNIIAVYGEDFVVDENDNIIGQSHKRDFDAEEIICAEFILPQSSLFFRRSGIEVVGGCDRTINYCPDYNLWVKMACKFKMLHVNEVWSCFRKNPKSQVAGKRWLTTRDRRHTIADLCNHPEYSPIISRLWRRAFASIYLEEVCHCAEQYRKSKSLRLILKSISVYPLVLFSRPKRVGYALKSLLLKAQRERKIGE